MKRLKFNNVAELGNFIYELASVEFQTITTVLFFDEAIELIKWLMLYDDVTIGSIDIENEDYSGYYKEFYITLDADLVLDATPAYRLHIDKSDEGYYIIESDIGLYDGDASSKLAIQNIHDKKYEIVIDNYYDNYDDEYRNECCDCCEDCSKCSHKSVSETIFNTLELFDHILSHLEDN